MKTVSARSKERIEGIHFELNQAQKELIVFKGTSALLGLGFNTIFLYFFIQYFMPASLILRIVSVFVGTLIVMLLASAITLYIIIIVYDDNNANKFIMMDGSYSQFFLVTSLYSVITSFAFSFGAFWLIYDAFAVPDIFTLIISYALAYSICYFFSYGVVSYFYNMARKQQIPQAAAPDVSVEGAAKQ